MCHQKSDIDQIKGKNIVPIKIHCEKKKYEDNLTFLFI